MNIVDFLFENSSNFEKDLILGTKESESFKLVFEIGANSVVNKKLDDFSFALGDPAKVLMDVRKFVVLGEGRPYP